MKFSTIRGDRTGFALPWLAGAVLVLAGLAACQAPAANDSATSFAAVAAANQADSQATGYLALTAPGRRDYLAINLNFDSQEDILAGFDLADFMQAGFDPARLDPADFLPGTPVYDLPTSTLLVSFDLGTASFESGRYLDKDQKPLTAVDSRVLMGEIVRHFTAMTGSDPTTGLNFLVPAKAVALEWAQDMDKTDPDLVFSLDPAPLVKAGLDPAKLQVWKVFKPAIGSPALLSGERLVLAYKLR